MAGRHRKPSSRHHRGRHRQPPPPTRWIAPTLATVAVLAAGGVSAYSALSGGGDSRPANHPVAAAPTTTTTPAAARPTLTVAPTASPTPTSDQMSGRAHPAHPVVALRLVVVQGVSWVEVTRPTGHVAFSGLLRHGHDLVYRQGPVRVTVGNAGAVRAVRHGHGDGRLGRPGQVVRFTVR